MHRELETEEQRLPSPKHLQGEMDKTVIIVCAVVGSLGVLSAILGFSAEGTKLTPYTILVLGDECIYPQNPALGLGVCAAIFLLAAQVTVSAVGGCCGCCKSRSIPSETKRIISIVCAVSSWIAAVIAWVLLIEGAAWNANVVRMTAPNCYYLKDGVFAGAGVLSLAATALGITSYVLMTKPRQRIDAEATPPALPVKVGPQVPPPPAQGNIGSLSPNQDSAPHQARPSNEAPPEVAPSAPPEQPSELQAPAQVPPQSVPNPYDTPQCPHQVGLDGPVPLPHPTTANGEPAVSTVFRNELTRQGVKLAAELVEHTLLPNN